MIVDEEKKSVEIYLLKDKKYILASNPSNKPSVFTFDDACKIDILTKNIWE